MSILKSFTPNAPVDGWVRLRYGSDWGGEYLSREPYEVVPCEYYDGFASKLKQGFDQRSNSRRRYQLAAGDPIRVRLTNGQERDAVVRIRVDFGTESDMGRSYTTRVDMPIADFGDGTTADLTAIDIRYERDRDPTAAELGCARCGARGPVRECPDCPDPVKESE